MWVTQPAEAWSAEWDEARVERRGDKAKGGREEDKRWALRRERIVVWSCDMFRRVGCGAWGGGRGVVGGGGGRGTKPHAAVNVETLVKDKGALGAGEA